MVLLQLVGQAGRSKGDLLSGYDLHRKPHTAPTMVLRPGEKYAILYAILNNCPCGYLNPHSLTMHAKLASDKTPLRNAQRIGAVTVAHQNLRCGHPQYRSILFTAPNPKTFTTNLGSKFTKIRVGLCPPKTKYACSQHVIKVSNLPAGGWQISVPKLQQRAIGSGVNRVVAGKRVSFEITVKNLSGKVLYPGSGASIRLQQVSGTTLAPNYGYQLDAVGVGKSVTIPFSLRARTTPGIYGFKACLTGLKDTDGWPLPDTCGPATAITVGAPDAGKWEVSAIFVDNLGTLQTRAPKGKPIRASVFIRNLSNHNYPAGTRYFSIWSSGNDTNSVAREIFSKKLAAIETQRKLRTNFRLGRINRVGVYNFRACTAGKIHAKIVDSICGPWSPITVGVNKFKKNQSDDTSNTQTCSGGRNWDAAKNQCVCPRNKPRWNPQSGRCFAVVTAPSCSDPKRRRADGKCCPRGQVARLNRCVKQVKATRCADPKRRRADGKCCPVGKVARLNRCVKKVRVTRCADPKRRRADGKCCPKGQVARLNRCVRVPLCAGSSSMSARLQMAPTATALCSACQSSALLTAGQRQMLPAWYGCSPKPLCAQMTWLISRNIARPVDPAI